MTEKDYIKQFSEVHGIHCEMLEDIESYQCKINYGVSDIFGNVGRFLENIDIVRSIEIKNIKPIKINNYIVNEIQSNELKQTLFIKFDPLDPPTCKLQDYITRDYKKILCEK